jgi:uncharacterized phage protein (TIGR02218 family)
MPRTCPTGLYNHLQKNCTTIATCLQITRTDGVIIGLTTCAQQLIIGGTVYQYLNSFEPSAIKSNVGKSGDIEVTCILGTNAFTAADVLAGRYSGAIVEVFWVDYMNVANGQMIMMTGLIGDMKLSDLGVVITIKDLIDLLKQTVGEQYTSCCRVRDFGNSQCDPENGLNVSQYNYAWTVAAVTTNFQYTLTAAATSPSGNYYTFGKCTFTSGQNKGLMRTVAADAQVTGTQCTITLYEPFPLPVAVGDTVTLQKGCGRLFANCQSFPSSTNVSGNNGENFRGEPFLPGSNQLIQVGR